MQQTIIVDLWGLLGFQFNYTAVQEEVGQKMEEKWRKNGEVECIKRYRAIRKLAAYFANFIAKERNERATQNKTLQAENK